MIDSLVPNSEETHAKRVYGLIAAGLLLPMLLYSGYVLMVVPSVGIWGISIVGLLLSMFSATSLILCIRTWEHYVRATAEALVEVKTHDLSGVNISPEPVARADTPPLSPEHEALISKFPEMKRELAELTEKLEGEDTKIQALEDKLREVTDQNDLLEGKIRTSAEDSDHKEGILHDYQQTIAEQRGIIDKKQQYVAKLEAKVQDLQYEVKTLLQLGELGVQGLDVGRGQSVSHPALDVFHQGDRSERVDLDQLVGSLPSSSDRKVYTHYDAAVQLQKSLDLAKKLTGASHLVGVEGSRFRDLSIDSYAIDLRRLFDSLRSDTSATILLYSQKDDKLLFVNNQIKGLVGWAPEKFVNDFTLLIQSSFSEWKHAIAQLGDRNEGQVRLMVKNREGLENPLHCSLGLITDGAFSGHVIGVLYPAEVGSSTRSL